MDSAGKERRGGKRGIVYFLLPNLLSMFLLCVCVHVCQTTVIFHHIDRNLYYQSQLQFATPAIHCPTGICIQKALKPSNPQIQHELPYHLCLAAQR